MFVVVCLAYRIDAGIRGHTGIGNGIICLVRSLNRDTLAMILQINSRQLFIYLFTYLFIY